MAHNPAAPVKTLLLSQFPLPYAHIGSWTTLYRNYLSAAHGIDILICKPPKERIPSVQYYEVKESLPLQIKMRLTRNNKLGYLNALKKAIRENPGRLVIQVIDDSGLTVEVNRLLLATGRRKDFYLQHFYHGFSAFPQAKWPLYEAVDELTLLTHDSHKAILSEYGPLNCHVSVLHNGIDTRRFHKVDPARKHALQQQLGLAGKKVFMWCSADRPKKGLDFILKVWQKLYSDERQMLLVVIGATREQSYDGVTFLGRIPNESLAEYYQAADCYLFPTLWEEPFGLSLIEAMHCGAFCIASALGGVPEVLQYGKLGKLVQNPLDPAQWEQTINEFMDRKYPQPQIPESIYTLEQWNDGMNQIINASKRNLESRWEKQS